MKKVYRSGEFEPRTELPAIVNRLQVSVLIDMPLSEVKDYLSKILSIDSLLQDDILVEKLEQQVEDYR